MELPLPSPSTTTKINTAHCLWARGPIGVVYFEPFAWTAVCSCDENNIR